MLASSPGERSLVRGWRDADRHARLFRGGREQFHVTSLRHGWKVEVEHHGPRVRIDTAPVEVSRRANILLNRGEDPVLIWPLVVFRFFNRLAPLRGQAIERQ